MAEILVKWKQYVEEECSITIDTDEWEAAEGEPWNPETVTAGDLHGFGDPDIRETGGSEVVTDSMTFKNLSD